MLSTLPGILTSERSGQWPKALEPISVTLSGMATDTRFLQFQNVLRSIRDRPEGSTAEDRPDISNAWDPMSITASGMTAESSLPHQWKAYSPIRVTASGMTTDDREEQPSKVYAVRERGRMTEDRFPHPEKALSPIKDT